VNDPTVVICGRPNVGKSSLFNALLKRRVAIVDPTAGVTRDRVTALVERSRGRFLLMDTGGIGLFDEVLLKHEVESQIETALAHADVVLFLVDAKEGLTPVDEEIARRLRGLNRPMLLVANKCDGISIEREMGPLYALGLGDPLPVSSIERHGVEDLMDLILEALPERSAAPEDDGAERIRLAIVGKVNSGKSTLMNLLVGEDRVIVSELAGTTRDAVDAPFELGGRKFTAVDTAGLRKRRVVEGTPDFYGQGRAGEAIRRADVVLLLVDATKTVSQIDKGIANAIAMAAKPVVIGVTKWDLAAEAGKSPEDFGPYVLQQLPMLEFAPLAFLSSLTRFNVDETLEVCADLYDQSLVRIGTGLLNRTIERAFEMRQPRVSRGKYPKILYSAQVDVRPPTILVHVNDKKLFDDEYVRYLSNRLREEFEFSEVPLRILFKDRHEGQAE